MQWDYGRELKNDYPKEVKKLKNEIGYYETEEGIIRVFKKARKLLHDGSELTKG